MTDQGIDHHIDRNIDSGIDEGTAYGMVAGESDPELVDVEAGIRDVAVLFVGKGLCGP